MASCRARVGAVALALACTAGERTASALNCPDLSPRLLFTYPNRDTPTLAPDAVLWAVGTNLVVLSEAYLDGTLRLEPSGAAPPDNWMFVPPEPMSPGRHSVDFVFENLEDERVEVDYVDFEVLEGTAASVDANVAAVALSGQRFSLPTPLFGPQRSAYEAEMDRLAGGPGDCSAYVQAQFGYCYDSEQGDARDVWGRNGRGAPLLLWTGLTPHPNALGFVMGERFLPPRCTGVIWHNDRFEGSIEALPLLPTGTGSPVTLADREIFTWEPPAPPRRPRFGGGHNCALASGTPAARLSGAALLVLLTGALARRRRRRAAIQGD